VEPLVTFDPEAPDAPDAWERPEPDEPVAPWLPPHATEKHTRPSAVHLAGFMGSANDNPNQPASSEGARTPANDCTELQVA
jgi:hypothetical protein